MKQRKLAKSKMTARHNRCLWWLYLKTEIKEKIPNRKKALRSFSVTFHEHDEMTVSGYFKGWEEYIKKSKTGQGESPTKPITSPDDLINLEIPTGYVFKIPDFIRQNLERATLEAPNIPLTPVLLPTNDKGITSDETVPHSS